MVEAQVTDLFGDKGVLQELLTKSLEFAREYFCLLVDKRSDKLGECLALLDGGLLKRKKSQNDLSTIQYWRSIFTTLLLKAVDQNDHILLEDLLNEAHGGKEPRIGHAAQNHPAFISTCLKDNIGQIRLFLMHNYSLSSVFMKQERQTTWLSWLISLVKKSAMDGDQIGNLNILRAMSRPNYIIARYQVVSEKAKYDFDCTCNELRGKVSLGNLVDMKVNNHLCPNHELFVPTDSCFIHPECNDPIYLCFAIECATKQCAKQIPEYKTEYLDIAKSCQKLSTEIVAQCSNNDEVNSLLQWDIGVKAFFPKTQQGKLTYPRLDVALMNDNKLFVGQVFCQQLLRLKWSCNAHWHERRILSKLVYCLLNIVLLYPSVIHYLLRLLMSDLGLTRERWKKLRLPMLPYNFLTGPCLLDVPLNRFITFTWLYILFAYCLLYNALTPNKRMLDKTLIFLMVYVPSLAITDLHAFIALHQTQNSNKFWRIFDGIFHSILFLAFFTTGKVIDFESCLESGISCSLDLEYKSVRFSQSLSSFLLSLSIIFCLLRIFYWLQLNSHLGPFIIYLNHIIVDYLFFFLLFFIVDKSFLVGLLPLLQSKRTVCGGDNSIDFSSILENRTVFNQLRESMHVFFFWEKLNPQPPEILCTDSIEGTYSLMMLAFYLVTVAIVLMTLLIAIMNSTIQIITDEKKLYWKFVRASIWIEFIKEDNVLPPPFNVIIVFRHWLKAVWRKIWAKIGSSRLKTCQPANHSRISARRGQNKLILTLIDRLQGGQRTA